MYSRVELFINKVADNKRNGVVGSNGINIPIIPRNNEIKPRKAKRYLRKMLEGCLINLVNCYLVSLNPILLCVPSQKGIVDDLPHLQIATLSAFANLLPFMSVITNFPEIRAGPSLII